MWMDDILTKLASGDGAYFKTDLEEEDKIQSDEEPKTDVQDGSPEKDESDLEIKESSVFEFLGLEKDAGKEQRGMRTGTGPFAGSFQAAMVGKGKRQMAGLPCPVVEAAKEEGKEEGKEEEKEKQEKESAAVLSFLGFEKDAGKDEPGKRDGTGPFKGSFQAKTKKKGKRQEAGEDCPFSKGAEDETLLKELTAPTTITKEAVTAAGRDYSWYNPLGYYQDYVDWYRGGRGSVATPYAGGVMGKTHPHRQNLRQIQRAYDEVAGRTTPPSGPASQTPKPKPQGTGINLRDILLYGGIPLAAYGGYRLLAGDDEEERRPRRRRRVAY